MGQPHTESPQVREYFSASFVGLLFGKELTCLC
ncbi:hypothetical protein DJ41_3605 [Acinetobacter baumannii ATCC 19606 = CIP 70.34 = JCM 6841]|nr:hypothetical protein DJ41_3605 [Acinetobacter baumannii ATCC 19606 = CIP 70.34 = JCM 6841]